MFKYFALILCCLLLACGRAGAPKPPEAFAPAEIRYLEANADASRVQIRWHAPVADARGDALEDLAGFEVRRRLVELEEEDKPFFDEIGQVELSSGQMSPLPNGEQALRFRFQDKDVEQGLVYEYAVVPFNTDGVFGRVKQYVKVSFVAGSSIVEIR